jgi:16S rRNA (adenine(1408)-N(1))-methyltransferase
VAEPIDDSIDLNSSISSRLTGEGIILDIGTGDGLFVYQAARRNPRKFFIGVDANSRPLEKISEKIHRRPQKGGAPNALFIQAAVENLPEELDGVADEVHVHFPWGSLLRAVATGDTSVLANLRRICAADAMLEVVAGLDPDRDRLEMQRLGVELVSIEYIDSVLKPRYREAGFLVMRRGVLAPDEWARLSTTWAKRLSGSDRAVWYIVARAV